MILFLLNLLLV